MKPRQRIVFLNAVRFGVLAALVSLCVLGCAGERSGSVSPDPRADPRADEVVAVAEAIFLAMRSRDAEALRAHFVVEARIYRVGPGPRGPADVADVSVPKFVEAVTAGAHLVEERFTQTPSVRCQGRLAQLWGPYELRVDGDVHHCGVNSMQLVEQGGRWLVTAITYSDDPAACGG